MGENERLSDAALGQIVGAIEAMETRRSKEADGHHHICRFDSEESKRAHVFFQLFDEKAQDSFRTLIKVGARMQALETIGWGAFVVTIIGALLTALGLGIKEWLKKV